MRATSHGEKRVLKGAMREKQAPKTWCLAERYHGDSQEACIVLRGMQTLTYLAYDVSQRASNLTFAEGVRANARNTSLLCIW